MSKKNHQKKVIIIAAYRANIYDGFHHRVFQFAQSITKLNIVVEIIWYLPLGSFFRKRILPRTYPIYYIPLFPTFSNAILRNFRNNFYSCITKFICFIRKADLIQAETPDSANFANTKLPLIVDYHGDLIAEDQVNSIIPDLQKSKQKLKEEKKINLKSLALITVSNNLTKVLVERNTILPPVYMVPCGVNCNRFKTAINDRKLLREKFGIDNKIVFCYLGGLFAWQCIEETLEINIELKKTIKNHFLLIISQSDFTKYNYLLNKLGENKIDYIILSLTSNEVSKILPIADIGFLLRKESQINYVSSPTKAGEYLAAGIPIITTKWAGNVGKFANDYNCGFILEELNITNKELENLSSYVINVSKNRGIFSIQSQKCAMNAFSWDKGFDDIKKLYLNG